MKKRKIINLIIISVALILIASQFFLADIVSKYAGSDDQAVAIITEVSPNYKPWAFSIWEPSSAITETILFAFQTALGLGVIVFYIINRNSKLKEDKCN